MNDNILQNEVVLEQLPPLLVSDATVARLLGCSRRQVWRLAAAGFLPKPVKIKGIGTRWSYEDIKAAVEHMMAKGR